MISLSLLTVGLVVWFPYALALVPNEKTRANAPNGELRMNIVRWVEDKGKDVNRVVRLLDSSQIDIEPNKPFVVHRRRKPLKRHLTSENIWNKVISEPGTWSLDGIRADFDPQKQKGTPPPLFSKRLSTTWTWAREHDMNYLLNVSQPASKKVPAGSAFIVGAKDYWEFNLETPMSWHEADQECTAAGLKLAQPKTHAEVIDLQKELHNRRHGRDIGCKDETWTMVNGYCFKVFDGFKSKKQAMNICKAETATLLSPTLGDHTAWKEAIATWSKLLKNTTRKSVGTAYAGATKALDGQWYWEDDSVVADDSWTPGKPSGDGDFSTINADSGLLMDKGSSTWKVVCQGVTNSYWLGGLGSSSQKCVEWVGGKCIEDEDHEHDKHIVDLWQTQPGDKLEEEEEEYALQLQIEHNNPFALRKTTDKRPFICESACPLGFINYGTQCLLVKKVWLPWRNAAATCIEMGLQLYEPDDEPAFKTWLTQTAKHNDPFWIGGSEERFTGRNVDIAKINKGLQFICELIQGTRKINVTNQLSYADEKKDFKLPKFVTECPNRTVTVSETEIEEIYPFSVAMDITGWMWVEYNKETDEHGSDSCDNNNDWVGGEDCWAHSKWGYSTSYLQNGDEICAHGDNATLTLNGTVTYIYNQYEVKVDNDECQQLRSKRSVGERKPRRRSKRSIASEKAKINIKTKANSQEHDDNNKPLMSHLGKRASEWVRSQAKERDAHLVEYHLDKISQIVTHLSLEEEQEGLMSPGSIFEEEFENTGTTKVITTFKKTKTISNSYRWSVKKGLNIEDSHISSYSMTDINSASNSFSVANNIAQKEGTSQSVLKGDKQSEGFAGERSSIKGQESTNEKTVLEEENNRVGKSSQIGSEQEESIGSEIVKSDTSTTGKKVGGSRTATLEENENRGTSVSEVISTGTSQTDSQSNKKSKSDTSSISSTQASSRSSSKSDTRHTEKGSSVTTGGEVTTKSSGFSFIVSFGSTTTTKAPTRTESTKSSETSTKSSSNSSLNSRTSSSSQTSGSESSQTATSTKTDQNTKSTGTNVNIGKKTGQSERLSEEETEQSESQVGTKQTDINKVSQIVTDTNSIDSSTGKSRGISDKTSSTVENKESLLKTQNRVKSIEEKLSKNQESIRSMENTYGKNVAKAAEESRGNQKTHTQQVTLDKNEEVESSAEEVLDTQNEIIIPPKTKVKIEWNVKQRKVRLPWKASIVMTGWINVRFNKSKDQVCDIFHSDDSETNDYTNTRWTYNYNNSCEKDNRLYGYPLSYLQDKNFIKEGTGLRFTSSGVFEAVVATSHFLRVTETPIEDYSDYDYEQDESRRRRRSPRLRSSRLRSSNYGLEYDDYDEEPQVSRRMKRAPRVTEYRMDFDEYGNGRVDLEGNNRHIQKFHAKKKFHRSY